MQPLTALAHEASGLEGESEERGLSPGLENNTDTSLWVKARLRGAWTAGARRARRDNLTWGGVGGHREGSLDFPSHFLLRFQVEATD